jgi:tetratricopeptide (TPR) repeat protein
MDPNKRLEVPPDSEAAARDSQIEALLVDGLDRYFARRYEEAIHLWTRVLFLDRSHARARAYIERARTALAEGQRRADELLAKGHSLIDQGRTDAARDVLAEAVAATGDDERASAFRLRLERVERVERARGTATAERRASQAVPQPHEHWATRLVGLQPAALVAAAAVLGLLVAFVTVPAVQSLMGLPAERPEAVLTASALPLPVLSSTDVALVRARTLYSRGRLADALRVLNRVGADSPARAAADQLRIEIQRLLLASGRESYRSPAGTGSHTP